MCEVVKATMKQNDVAIYDRTRARWREKMSINLAATAIPASSSVRPWVWMSPNDCQYRKKSCQILSHAFVVLFVKYAVLARVLTLAAFVRMQYSPDGGPTLSNSILRIFWFNKYVLVSSRMYPLRSRPHGYSTFSESYLPGHPARVASK